MELLVWAFDWKFVGCCYVLVSYNIALFVIYCITVKSAENLVCKCFKPVCYILYVWGEWIVFHLGEYGSIFHIEDFKLCCKAFCKYCIAVNELAVDIIYCILSLHFCLTWEHGLSCIVIIDCCEDVVCWEETWLSEHFYGSVICSEYGSISLCPVVRISYKLCNLESFCLFWDVHIAYCFYTFSIIINHAYELYELVIESLNFAYAENIIFDFVLALADSFFDFCLILLDVFVKFINCHLRSFSWFWHELSEKFSYYWFEKTAGNGDFVAVFIDFAVCSLEECVFKFNLMFVEVICHRTSEMHCCCCLSAVWIFKSCPCFIDFTDFADFIDFVDFIEIVTFHDDRCFCLCICCACAYACCRNWNCGYHWECCESSCDSSCLFVVCFFHFDDLFLFFFFFYFFSFCFS